MIGDKEWKLVGGYCTVVYKWDIYNKNRFGFGNYLVSLKPAYCRTVDKKINSHIAGTQVSNWVS